VEAWVRLDALSIWNGIVAKGAANALTADGDAVAAVPERGSEHIELPDDHAVGEYRAAVRRPQIQNDMNTPIAPPAPDLVSPTVPSNLAAVASSSSQINLSWSASTDDVGVAGYRVTRGGVVIATTTATIFADSGLAAQTAYTYSVAAFDAATNVSAESAPASATPQQAPAATGSPTSRACGTARRFSST
jgi:hypothetical protein